MFLRKYWLPLSVFLVLIVGIGLLPARDTATESTDQDLQGGRTHRETDPTIEGRSPQ